MNNLEIWTYKELIEEWNKNKEKAEDICEFECNFCGKPKKTLIYVNDGDNVCCYHCWIKPKKLKGYFK